MNETINKWVRVSNGKFGGFVKRTKEGGFDAILIEQLKCYIYAAYYYNLTLEDIKEELFTDVAIRATYLGLPRVEEQISFGAFHTLTVEDYSQFEDFEELSEELVKEGVLSQGELYQVA